MDTIGRFVAGGYPWEIAGLVYYVFFLVMGRGANAERFSMRSRVMVLVAAIALVACGPFGYAARPAGVGVMCALAFAALVSSGLDARRR